jgi:hypothetical protein
VPIQEEQAAIREMQAMRPDHTLREIAAAMRQKGHAISVEGVRRCLNRAAESTESAA